MNIKKILKLKKDRYFLVKVLNSLRLKNHFYKASVSKDYSYTWLRDNFFCAIPQLWKEPKSYIKTYQTWLDYYIKIEEKYSKFTSLINKCYIEHEWEFPNPRINGDLSEIHESGWVHLQIDQFGYFYYGVAIGEKKGLKIIRNQKDIDIINKSITMLEKLNFPYIAESGIWEGNREYPRASTIGVVYGGLKALSELNIQGINIPTTLIENSLKSLESILPKETPTRETDLAQLILMYPFTVMSEETKNMVLENIENNLISEKGLKRYVGDKYFFNECEANWTMGFCFLGLIFCEKGDFEKAFKFYNKLIKNSKAYKIPELYLCDTQEENENTPLAWSVALTIELGKKLEKHHGNIIKRIKEE